MASFTFSGSLLSVDTTETIVKNYMAAVLGATASKLDMYVSSGSFDEPLNELSLLFSDTSLSAASANDTRKFRMAARVEAWRAAMYTSVELASYSVGAPGTGSVQLQDIHRQSKAMYQMALDELKQAYPTFTGTAQVVASTPIDYGDPYQSVSASYLTEWG